MVSIILLWSCFLCGVIERLARWMFKLSSDIHLFLCLIWCWHFGFPSANTPAVIYLTDKILNSISMGIFLLVLPSRLTLHIILIQSPKCSSVKSSTPSIKETLWKMQQNYWDYCLTKSRSCALVSSVSSWRWPWHWGNICFSTVNSEELVTQILQVDQQLYDVNAAAD
jgi:hypothetical protein